MVERASLERKYTIIRIEGSNPSFSEGVCFLAKARERTPFDLMWDSKPKQKLTDVKFCEGKEPEELTFKNNYVSEVGKSLLLRELFS